MIRKMTIIGAGAMGTAFARGMIAAGVVGSERLVMVDVDPAKRDAAAGGIGAQVSNNSVEAVSKADVVLIAVKPGVVESVLGDIAKALEPSQLLISIAAGVTLWKIERSLPGNIGAIRAMPNTPCQIGAGAVGFSRGECVTDEQAAIAKSIFDSVGVSFELPERMLDAVTGLSGSGPAYIYLIIEALSDAGVRVGLPRGVALALATHTMLGSARMVMESGEHPAKLKDQVTSPGGTTIAGIDALEKAGLRSALIEAVKAATARSAELE